MSNHIRDFLRQCRKTECAENHRRFFRKLKCSLGFHTWRTYWEKGCTLTVGNRLFGTAHRDSGEATLQVCKHCSMERALLSNGIITQTFDVGYLKRSLAREGIRV